MWTKSILLFLFNYSISVLYGQAIDKSFVSPLSSNDVVFGMALQPDGKIIIGGNFSTSGIISRKLVRLNPNGTIDSSFNVGTGFTGGINEIILQTDGKLLVGGFFTAFNNRPVRNVVRLLSNGTLDSSFNIGTGVDGANNSVQCIRVDENGKIYVGGDITRFNGKPANMLIRLNANGTLDSSFVGTAEYRGRVIAFAFQPDGKILVGGVITKLGSPVVAMIRLESNGSLDNSFAPSSTTLNSVNSIIVLPNNKILAGGDFQNYNGKPYSSIVRLEANGAVDESFSVGTGFYAITGGIFSYPLYMVSDMALTNEGKILIAGYFREYNRTNVDGIIQLNPDGSISNTFQACNNKFGLSSGNIYDIAVQPNGRIIVGGYFIFRNDTIAKNIFRLLPDPPLSGTPVSNFDFTLMGNEVSFIDSSKNTVSKEWDFNDGTYSTVSNPVHNYAKSGIYNVRLTARGLCDNTITLSKRITIVGLQSHFPTKGGNNGSVIITINGAYFTDKSTVKLLRNGSEVIGRDILLADNGKTLYATLDLYSKELGLYDLVVTTGTNVTSLRNSFTVEQSRPKQLSINIDGRDTIRTGSIQKYNIVINNQSNNDARGVPVWLAVPKGSVINFNFAILVPKNTDDINYDSIPLFAQTDTLFDRAGDYDVYGFVLRNVPAGQSRKMPFDIRFVASSDIYAWVTTPMYGSPLLSDVGSCMYGLLRVIAQANPFTECAGAAMDIYLEPMVLTNKIEELEFKYRVYGRKETAAEKMSLYKLYNDAITTSEMNMLINIADCLPNRKGLKQRNYKYIKEWTIAVLTELRYAWGKYKKPKIIFTPQNDDIFKLFNTPEQDEETPRACNEALIRLGFIKRRITTVGSMDPNEKVGPSGISAANHILPSAPFNYTIHFENISTATAPAQEVIIIDTLNKSLFDIKSFQLNDFGFGKYATKKINPGLFEYAGLIDLRPSNNLLVKVNAKLDTAKGILTWRFFSIDPKTLDLPEDPFAGFLPPNNADNAGQGFVSYSIIPKVGLPDNTVLSNKALIYFDYNPPIATNTFFNTLDINKPKSKVELLQPIVSDTTFKVIWGGNDIASGVRSYDVYYSVNNGLFKIWKYDVSATEGMFTGKLDSTYNFYSIARDYAGNVENAKQSAEATTQVKMIVTGIDNVDVNGHFYLYPNPSQHTVNIDFNFPAAESLTIVIRDIMGRIVATILSDELTLAGKKIIPFNTSILPKGVYLCELKSKKYNKVLKFVKE